MILKSVHSANFRGAHSLLKAAVVLTCFVISSCIGSQGSDLLVKPVSEVDEVPSIVGGVQYIVDELKYPKEAKDQSVEGRVLIQFVVNPSGDVRDAQIVEGIGHGCDEEALRVIEKAKFTPGKVKGEVVPVQMMIPLHFKLQ